MHWLLGCDFNCLQIQKDGKVHMNLKQCLFLNYVLETARLPMLADQHKTVEKVFGFNVLNEVKEF